VALAAALAPGRAPILLAHLTTGADEAAALARELATAPRRARLAALAAALPHPPSPFPAVHPLLARLAREPGRAAAALEAGARRLDAARTAVRPADHRGGGRG
jgi:hypothetical protein